MAPGILWRNLADAATPSLAVGTATPSAPLSNLADPQPRRRARINLASGNNCALILDLGALLPIDTVGLVSTTLGPDATIIVRASASDPAGLADLVWSSGTLACQTDDAANGNVWLLRAAGTVEARYIRITLTDPAASVLDIGRVVIGAMTRLAAGYSYGAQQGRQILDQRTRNAQTGAEFATPALGNPRVEVVTLPLLTLAEISGAMRALTYELGGVGDALWLPDLDLSMAERNQRAIWAAFNPAGGRAVVTRDRPLRGTRSFDLTERL